MIMQTFYAALEDIEMEYCARCKELWFNMRLRGVCHNCFNRDEKKRTTRGCDPNMDPGEVPACLPKLTQIEEMIIACSHVQMMVFQYQGHQYHYSATA